MTSNTGVIQGFKLKVSGSLTASTSGLKAYADVLRAQAELTNAQTDQVKAMDEGLQKAVESRHQRQQERQTNNRGSSNPNPVAGLIAALLADCGDPNCGAHGPRGSSPLGSSFMSGFGF